FLLHFLLLARPPPSSTLFPYTTLFRSGRAVGGFHAEDGQRAVADAAVGVIAGDRDRGAVGGDGADERRRRCGQIERRHAAHPCLDRKSTRLNSSHVAISYAVFCLKKKN